MKRGEVKISTEGYLREVLDDFPKEITGRVKTLAAKHLFEVRSGKEQVILDKPRARAFHHSATQLLFTLTRLRKDIHKAVAFLTTRVRSPGEDERKKLRRLLQYVKSTIRMLLRLSADKLNVVKWWVDASYAAHNDMRRHNGATMSLGRGSVLSMSKKQKINTKSSIKAELIRADNALPQIMWTKYFIEAHGYGIDKNIMYQDNLSAMLL